jgi:hypothetical protein
MSGKSRHGKGRRFHYSKKSKALRRQGTAPGVSPATAGMPEVSRPAAAATTPLVPKAAAISKAKTTENPYPYIASELGDNHHHPRGVGCCINLISGGRP